MVLMLLKAVRVEIIMAENEFKYKKLLEQQMINLQLLSS